MKRNSRYYLRIIGVCLLATLAFAVITIGLRWWDGYDFDAPRILRGFVVIATFVMLFVVPMLIVEGVHQPHDRRISRLLLSQSACAIFGIVCAIVFLLVMGQPITIARLAIGAALSCGMGLSSVITARRR